jgi:Fic family protein
MDASSFNGKSGKVVLAETKKHGKYSTFLPNALPVKIDLNNLAGLVEQATLQLGKLNGMARSIPNPYLFTRLYTKKEALMSSRIEGTQSSLEEVLMAEAEELNKSYFRDGYWAGGRPVRASDLLEVRNLIKASEEGVESIRTEKITLPLLLRLHRILLKGVRGGERNPGALRSVPNWLGPAGTRIQDSIYVPPPPESVRELLTNLLDYLNGTDNLPKLVRIAIAHYQFEAIHPFEDGNGRIGRLMVILYMLEAKLLDLELLYLSEYFERNRSKYYDLLLKVSQQGTYGEWVSFFLNGIIEQTNSVIEKVSALLEFSDKTRKRLEKERSPYVLLTFESLLSNPYVTIPTVAKMNKISYPAAKRVVSRLIAIGVLKKLDYKNARGKIFGSRQIIEIIDS